MSVQQEVIPGLPIILSNFMIIPPKRQILIISSGKGEEEKKWEIKK